MLAEAVVPALVGNASPRISPPPPARSGIDEFRATAEGIGITLMPWQETAGRYLTATNADGFPLFREVCIVVARQNGKTHLTKPFIIQNLRLGRRIMHIGVTSRELPRLMFPLISESIDEKLFLKRRGRAGKMVTIWPRFGQGQEEILLQNDGAYRIAAANRGGARGFTNDIVIIDELREMDTDDVMAAAESTTITSPYAQLVYLSNAGTDDSIVLNAIRDRAQTDPSLAYLEWSADPDLDAADPAGWVQANPAIGHIPTTLRGLEMMYQKHSLGGSLHHFETENLCRWVKTMRPALVTPDEWNAAEAQRVPKGARTFMAVSMDPDGARASAAVAWVVDEVCYVSIVDDVQPAPASVVGPAFRNAALARGVRKVGFDPMTDAELAKQFRVTKAISGREFANATANFVGRIRDGSLRWTDAAVVGDDLSWTSRKENDETGSFQAVRANDDRPITAALAAIRAVWLATGIRTASTLRVY